MHKKNWLFLVNYVKRGEGGRLDGRRNRMVLYSERMFRKWIRIPGESFSKGNKVPIAGKSIAETVINGYNFSKTNLHKNGTKGNK